MRKGLLLTLVLWTGLLVIVDSTWAANVQMSASIGFNGIVQPGRWVPLWVKIKGAPKDATIEVARRSFRGFVERYPCSVPSTQEARFELPFFAPETGDVATVRLIAGGQILAEQRLKTYESIFPGHIILTVQTPAQVEQSIAQALPNEPVKVIPTTAEELPSMIQDYDSISGLVLNDPDLRLKPAQKRALHCWLTGGGKLFIRSDAASILGDQFFSGNYQQKPYGRIYTLGLGRIVCSDQELSFLSGINEPRYWREALAIMPFTQSFRLTPGLLRADENPTPARQSVPLIFLVFAAIWGLGSLAVVLFLPRHKMMFFLLTTTLIMTLLAVPFGRWQQLHWHRGAFMHSRMLILPSGEGLFLTRIQLPDAKVWDAHGIKASPWGVPIMTDGTDFGLIQPLFNRVEWNHRTVLPFCSAMTAEKDNLSLMGSLDPHFLNDAFTNGGFPEPTAKWEKNQWYVATSTATNSRRWQRSKRIPPWLAPEQIWIEQAMLSDQDRPWLFGKGNMGNIGLSLQGGSNHEVIWMAPIDKEVGP